jgi:hypothetical protein
MRGFTRLASIGAALAVVLAVGLAGCGSGGSSSGNPGDSTDDGGGFVRPSVPGIGPQAWPSAMPADVPPFSGHMSMIMKRGESGGSYSVRMFFDGISDEQFEAYIETLRQEGWALKPETYYTPPETEEDAAERAARGDYDAWIATRAPRSMTLSVPHGSGQVTFDLGGLTQAESDALPDVEDMLSGLPTATPWPAQTWPPEWAGKVPEPQGCTLGANGNLTSSPTNLYVACGYPDADPDHHLAIIADYQADLAAAGFTPQDGPQSSTMFVYQKGPINVVVMTGADEWMIVSATERQD